ncbi:MAG: choice-of-anchor J domain-containing protein [Flavobacteriaceae bacterium]|nr:choice-of-anchor J domain-containing protein [Candidatus Onthonaster equi]
MKRTLLSFMVLAGLTTVNAQTTIYFEDFNTSSADNPPAGWVYEDLDGDGHAFGDIYYVPNLFGPPASPVSLISRSWQSIPLNPDNTATSPLMDLTAITGDIKLQWKVTATDAEWDLENYSVYISTSANIYEIIDSEPIFNEIYDDPTNLGNQFLREVDLSAYAGKQIYITFRHHNVTDMDWLSIDDIKVYTTSNLGITDTTLAKVSIYPNPVQDEFKINLSKEYNYLSTILTINDLSGRNIKSFKASEAYNISDLSKGVYILTVNDGVNKFTQKLIKK